MNIFKLMIEVFFFLDDFVGCFDSFDWVLDASFCFWNKVLLEFFKLTGDIFEEQVDLKNVLVHV